MQKSKQVCMIARSPSVLHQQMVANISILCDPWLGWLLSPHSSHLFPEISCKQNRCAIWNKGEEGWNQMFRMSWEILQQSGQKNEAEQNPCSDLHWMAWKAFWCQYYCSFGDKKGPLFAMSQMTNIQNSMTESKLLWVSSGCVCWPFVFSVKTRKVQNEYFA